MQHHAKAGGILAIVSGVFGLLGMAALIGMTYFFRFMFTESFIYDGFQREMFTWMAVYYLVVGIVLGLIGILAIVGGVYAIKRRFWAWRWRRRSPVPSPFSPAASRRSS